MKKNHLGVIGILGLTALTQCAKEPELAPAQSPAPSASSAASIATAASAAVPVASASPPAPAAYPMCGGQHLASSTPPARAGAVSSQLAPAFLDEMASCAAPDSLPKDILARAGEGSIDAQGNCVFANVGVSCHYHSGSEFINSSTKEEPVGQGELHCIFPSDDPKSPRVFGAHLTCSDPSRGKPPAGEAKSGAHRAHEGAHAEHEGAHAEHEAKSGAACSAALLSQLATCQSSKCCDDGTLTNVIGDLVHDGRNDVRPDFRICEQALTIDCSLLENLSAHPANAPALGGVGKPAFAIGAPASKPVSEARTHAAAPKAASGKPKL